MVLRKIYILGGGIASSIAALLENFRFIFVKADDLRFALSFGPKLKKQRVAIFASYSSSREDREEVIRLTRLLVPLFDQVVVVDTGIFPSEDLNGVIFYNRKNIGRDLFSFSQALNLFEVDLIEEILFFNDSVLWSNDSLPQLVNIARISKFEVTSVTASHQNSFHLQSYFIHIKNASKAALIPFDQLKPWLLKRNIVNFGEKFLTKSWLSSGVAVGGLFDQQSLSPEIQNFKHAYGEDYPSIKKLVESKVPLNPSIHFWPALLANTGVIKNVLIRSNPAGFKRAPSSLSDALSMIRKDNSSD